MTARCLMEDCRNWDGHACTCSLLDLEPDPVTETDRVTADETTAQTAGCDCESMGGRFGAHRPECPATAQTAATYDHDPCCQACGGAGGTGEGPCFDCYGTGHAHAPDSTAQTAGVDVEAVLAAHQFGDRGRVYDTCACGWYGRSHPGHVAAALAPVIAAAEQRGRERGRAEQAAKNLAAAADPTTHPLYLKLASAHLDTLAALRRAERARDEQAAAVEVVLSRRCSVYGEGTQVQALTRNVRTVLPPNTDAALADVRAEALRDAADEMDDTDDPDAIYVLNGDIDLWLRARADRIAAAALTPAEPTEGDQ